MKLKVNVMAAELDEHVEPFRTQPLDAGPTSSSLPTP